MAFETIAYSVDDGIARITLNRPERLNAINAQLISDLRDAVAAANDDGSVRVIVLSGAGRAFCCGLAPAAWGASRVSAKPAMVALSAPMGCIFSSSAKVPLAESLSGPQWRRKFSISTVPPLSRQAAKA